jgi:hypothetical protein
LNRYHLIDFEDIKQIGEGGIVKHIQKHGFDGKTKYIKQHDESSKRRVSEPMKFVLKRFNGSHNISVDYFIMYIFFTYLFCIIYFKIKF